MGVKTRVRRCYLKPLVQELEAMVAQVHFSRWVEPRELHVCAHNIALANTTTNNHTNPPLMQIALFARSSDPKIAKHKSADVQNTQRYDTKFLDTCESRVREMGSMRSQYRAAFSSTPSLDMTPSTPVNCESDTAIMKCER